MRVPCVGNVRRENPIEIVLNVGYLGPPKNHVTTHGVIGSNCSTLISSGRPVLRLPDDHVQIQIMISRISHDCTPHHTVDRNIFDALKGADFVAIARLPCAARKQSIAKRQGARMTRRTSKDILVQNMGQKRPIFNLFLGAITFLC
jgi:hypothetical protein